MIQTTQKAEQDIDDTDLSALQPVQKHAFVFVCEKGYLELQSLFLAASLRRFLRCPHELIAAIPQPLDLFGYPRELTLTLLRKMNVRIVDIHNDLVRADNFSNKNYLTTNKIFCLKVATDGDKLIFLDSDIIFYDEFKGDVRFSIPFNGCQVGLLGAEKSREKWPRVYKAAGVKMPDTRMSIREKNGRDQNAVSIPPYFNSGFVGIRTDLAHQLSSVWRDCFEAIESAPFLEGEKDFSEMMALSVALQKLDLPYDMFLGGDVPYYHYSQPKNLRMNWRLIGLLCSFLDEYPELWEYVKQEPEWRDLLAGKSLASRFKRLVGRARQSVLEMPMFVKRAKAVIKSTPFMYKTLLPGATFFRWLREARTKRKWSSLRRYVKNLPKFVREPVFVKVGANDGITSDPCSDVLLTNKQWKGLLIEPVPHCFERLKANFNDSRRFSLEQVAIGATVGEGTFHYVNPEILEHVPDLPRWYDQLGSFDKSHVLKHLDEKMKPFVVERAVEICTLSEVLKRNELRDVHLLHIDAEDHDYEILKTLDFADRAPVLILFEHKHLTNPQKTEMVDLLCRHGYAVQDCGVDYFAVNDEGLRRLRQRAPHV